MSYCHECHQWFAPGRGLIEHYVQSPYHEYCQYCDYHYDYPEELQEHYEDKHSYCAPCHTVFKNDYGLQEHFRQSAAHHYCAPCKRHFESKNNFVNHMNSSTHKAKDVMCPTAGCGLGFVSTSALVLHMESGTCKSGINRRLVNSLVHRYDTNHLITDPARMIGGAHPHQHQHQHQHQQQEEDQHITYYASEASFNAYTQRYECCLCPRAFSALLALNQHLGSLAHEQESYLCRGPTCGSRFRALSALVQHIESQKCGVARFQVVQNAMADVFGGVRRVGM